MRSAILPLLAAISVVLAACGTGEDPTAIDLTPGPPPPVEELRARAEEATAALNEGRWLDYYDFKSPRSVAPRFPYGLPAVQLCTEEQFVMYVGEQTARLRSNIGLVENEPLTWKIKDVRLGERLGVIYQGIVELDIYQEDRLVTDEFHDYFGESAEGARWVWFEDEWWVEQEDWRDGCHDTKLIG